MYPDFSRTHPGCYQGASVTQGTLYDWETRSKKVIDKSFKMEVSKDPMR